MSSSISCQMSRETQSPRTFFHEGKRVRIPNDVEFINRGRSSLCKFLESS